MGSSRAQEGKKGGAGQGGLFGERGGEGRMGSTVSQHLEAMM